MRLLSLLSAALILSASAPSARADADAALAQAFAEVRAEAAPAPRETVRLTWHNSNNDPGVVGLFRGDDQVGELNVRGEFRLRFGPGDFSEVCAPPIPLPRASAAACASGTCGISTAAGTPLTAPAFPQGSSAGGCSGGSCGIQAGPAFRPGRRGR